MQFAPKKQFKFLKTMQANSNPYKSKLLKPADAVDRDPSSNIAKPYKKLFIKKNGY